MIRCATKAALDALAAKTLFDFFRGYNLLEFKSSRDPLTVSEYHRILARAHLYIADHPPASTKDLMICVACSAKPIKLIYKSPDEVTFKRLGGGHYQSDDKIPMRVVVIGELTIERRNYPLLLFAGKKKRRQFFEELVRRGDKEYIDLAYELYPDELREVLEMSRRDYPTLEENIRFIVKDLGADRILQNIDPELMVKWILEHKGRAAFNALIQKISAENGPTRTSKE